jgi:hypothetical protein
MRLLPSIIENQLKSNTIIDPIEYAQQVIFI